MIREYFAVLCQHLGVNQLNAEIAVGKEKLTKYKEDHCELRKDRKK